MGKELFISHKSQDRHLGLRIKGLLNERVKRRGKSKPPLTIFLSCDADSITRGQLWLEQIHSALKRADSLMLLYTDQRQIWDWCMYESGYYAGKFKAVRQVTGLFVVHPRGTVPPGPLQSWQSILAVDELLCGMLDVLYSTSGGKSCFNGTPQDRLALAREIAAEVGRYARLPVPGPARLSLELNATPNPLETASHQPHFELTVTVGTALAKYFDAEAGAKLPWKEFVALSAVKASRLDTDGLRHLMGELVTARTVRAGTLPACILRGSGYRPVVESADLHEDGRGVATLVFQQMPDGLGVGLANKLDVLAHLLTLTRRFRHDVVEKYADLAETAPQNGTAPILKAGELIVTLESLRYDISHHITEALAVGIDSPTKLLMAFDQKMHSELAEAQSLWERGSRRLDKMIAEKSTDLEGFRQLFRMLRMANYKFLQSTITELHENYTQIPPPPSPESPFPNILATPTAATHSATPVVRATPPSEFHPPASDRIWLNELFGKLAESGGEEAPH